MYVCTHILTYVCMHACAYTHKYEHMHTNVLYQGIEILELIYHYNPVQPSLPNVEIMSLWLEAKIKKILSLPT